jgi:hypothetical protein
MARPGYAPTPLDSSVAATGRDLHPNKPRNCLCGFCASIGTFHRGPQRFPWPGLARHGYERVIIDSVRLKPKAAMSREQVMYRAHVTEYGRAKIKVIPRDRDLTDAQESGLDPVWFEGEVRSKTAGASQPCLVTTWTDGENGGWFRQMDGAAGFWGHFFAPYMERVRSNQMTARPISLSRFLAENPPQGKVEVQTGAWNVGSTSGYDFSQWAGWVSQRKALEAIWQLSRRYQECTRSFSAHREGITDPALRRARECILRAETSCYLFGEMPGSPSSTRKSASRTNGWTNSCSEGGAILYEMLVLRSGGKRGLCRLWAWPLPPARPYS